MAELLAPIQLGYGVRGGSEATVHAARRFLTNMEEHQAMVKLDCQCFQLCPQGLHVGGHHDILPIPILLCPLCLCNSLIYSGKIGPSRLLREYSKGTHLDISILPGVASEGSTSEIGSTGDVFG